MAKTLGSLNVGDKLEVPVKAEFQSFLGKSIVWKIADKNHNGYPANSVTMITDRIIATMPFDGTEPNFVEGVVKTYGNGRYSWSNIRLWLNSKADSGKWYVAQHAKDEPPDVSHVYKGFNAYNEKAGFLAMFPDKFVSNLLETQLSSALTSLYGSGMLGLADKVFLLSSDEIGEKSGGVLGEGFSIAILASGYSARIAYPTKACVDNYENPDKKISELVPINWYSRTPVESNGGMATSVESQGRMSSDTAYNGGIGIRPCCNLPQSFEISDTPNSDGNYTIANVNEYTIKVIPPKGYAKVPDQKLTAVSGESFNATFELPKAPDRIIYGLKIKTDNPDPFGAIEYTRDAAGMTPGSDDWFSMWPFNEIQPVVLKPDGTEAYELDRMDMRKKKDGTPAVLTGEDGNVMVRFPTIYLGEVDIGVPSVYTEQIISNMPLYGDIDGTNYNVRAFEPWRRGEWKAPYDEVEVAPYVYVSAFNAITNSTGHLASVIFNGEPAAAINNLEAARSRINANDKTNGLYWLTPYFMWNVIDKLYLLFFKTFQQKLGRGNHVMPDNMMGQSVDKATGANYNSGNTNDSMRFLWIENYYSGYTYYVEGTYIKGDRSRRMTCLRIETLTDPTKWDSNTNLYAPTNTGYIRAVTYGNLGMLGVIFADATSSTYLCSYYRDITTVAQGTDVWFDKTYSLWDTATEGAFTFTSRNATTKIGNRFCFFPGLKI